MLRGQGDQECAETQEPEQQAPPPTSLHNGTQQAAQDTQTTEAPLANHIPTSSEAAGTTVAQEHAVELTEFEREFNKAKENPSDFTQWVTVEKLLDREGSIEKTRQVYDRFLAEYPLCYAYWKKYAEWEHKHSSPEWAISVYERGTAAVPYSCDLWGHYAIYKQKLSAPANEIRQIFENGIAYVGTDYLSHVLWDKYVKFEMDQGHPDHVTRLYVQILGSPLRDIDRYNSSFKEYLHSRPISELLDAEELEKTRKHLQQARLNEGAQQNKANESVEVTQKAEEDMKLADTASQAALQSAANGLEPTVQIDDANANVTESEKEADGAATAASTQAAVEGSLEATEPRAQDGDVEMQQAEKEEQNGANATDSTAAVDMEVDEGEQANEIPPTSNSMSTHTAVLSSNEEVVIKQDGLMSNVKDEEAKQELSGPPVKLENSPGTILEASNEAVKQYWLSGISALYQATKEELARRKPFEDLIKRPYFHVKPLPAVQLEAWDAYIDFILGKDDAGTIVRLFERCLVACASYPGFWIRYVRYLSRHDPANAQVALQRAQQVHCKANVSLHLFAAKYQERTGDIKAARNTYSLLLTELAPDLLEAILQTANFERRQNDEAAACRAFEEALVREEAKEGISDTGAMMAMFYANFLHIDCKQTSKARALYQRVLQKWSTLRYLWEAALHFEEHSQEDGFAERVIELYKQVLAQKSGAGDLAFTPEDRESLSQRLVDFADRHCPPNTAAGFEEEHDAMFSRHKAKAAANKRASDSSAGEPAAKKAAFEQFPAASNPASAANSFGQEAAHMYPPAASTASTGQAPALAGATPPAAYPYQDPAMAFASQPMVSGAPQSAYYPQASAGYPGYGYGYQYPAHPQPYGYAYTGYQ